MAHKLTKCLNLNYANQTKNEFGLLQKKRKNYSIDGKNGCLFETNQCDFDCCWGFASICTFGIECMSVWCVAFDRCLHSTVNTSREDSWFYLLGFVCSSTICRTFAANNTSYLPISTQYFHQMVWFVIFTVRCRKFLVYLWI